MNDEMSKLQDKLNIATKALHEIYNYDEQPIWMDNRDDAADDMLELAHEAIVKISEVK